jgi:ABC-2 type transport system ATP-binding protein
MLSIEHLTVAFAPSHVAVADVSFQVHAGEIAVLLGANGAGKTTTLSCCLDFVRPTAGVVRVDDTVVAQRPLVAKRDIAFVPENVTLYGTLTGRENLCFFARLDGHRLTAPVAGDMLARAGLATSAIDRPVRTYSKGMRQKVGIAIALARRVRHVLLDEPTSGLDPVAARELLAGLRDLRDDGCAVLLTTHDLPRARDSADRVLVMWHGRLLSSWSAEELAGLELESAYLDAIERARRGAEDDAA